MRKLKLYTIIAVLTLTAASLSAAGPKNLNKNLPAAFKPVVVKAARFAKTPPLRELAARYRVDHQQAPKEEEREMRNEILPKAWNSVGKNVGSAGSDPVLQETMGKGTTPAPIANFEGIANSQNPGEVLPPDTNGDVGPNYYVQWVNISIAVWDKDGNLLMGPVPGNSLWSGFGGPADDDNDGDPIVLYDALADRWIVSQFALGPTNYQYIAVSQTPDPTGAWYLYAFEWPGGKMPDYPKFGVWPDGYYMSANQFLGNGWGGAGAAVFEREKMLEGDPTATMQYFDLGTVNSNYGGQLPTDFGGGIAPPVGSPDLFIEMDDDAWWPDSDRLSVWKFHVDWNTPANSTFGQSGEPDLVLDTASFDTDLCGYDACIPQPDTSALLDSLSDRLMFRLFYRNLGDHEALVVNHTVDVDGTDHAGVRWYELRKGSADWSIYQQGTYAPDSLDRWMGSIAIDRAGDIGLGYSVSSSSSYPSIRYTGRLEGDPEGQMTIGEGTLVEGAGSQESSYNRWGDYSSMGVDPSDGCTFWYTQEYYAATSTEGWQTRIGSFRCPTCTSATPISVTITPGTVSGPMPITVDFTASASGGTGNYTYRWAFGDGGSALGSSVSHRYTQSGNFKVWVTATDGNSPAGSNSASMQVGADPAVVSLVKRYKRRKGAFKLKVEGSNFHENSTVTIDGVAVPGVKFKNSGELILKKGSDLKAMVPKGTKVWIVVINNDDGGVSKPFGYTR